MTLAALGAKATIQTVSRCRRLTPADIARLNGVYVSSNSGFKGAWPPNSTYWRRFEDIGYDMLHGGFAPEEPMSRYEAMDVLGIDSEAGAMSRDTVRQRHRRMMMLNHPDKGGSKFLAMKINKAKEVLEEQWR